MDASQIKIREFDKNIARKLEEQGYNPLIARILAARGVTDIEQMSTDWHHMLDPKLMLNMEMTASLLADAIEQKKDIVIVADYDCDGATACAVAIRGIRMFGHDADFFVPNRAETGYGLSPELIDLLLKQRHKPELIITVDNGIASVDGVSYANSLGIDVIVTDHHLPGDEKPEALSIINPNQKGCSFPSKALAGVGVMFYLLIALRAEFRKRGRWADRSQEPLVASLVDLVAVGTVADVVKLDSNNRLLVEKGLSLIRSGKTKAGILALFNVASTPYQSAISTDLGFRIGPRINAAGRLADMSLGIKCLLTDDPNEAYIYATELDEFNKKRKSIEDEIKLEALNGSDSTSISKQSLVAFNKDWNPGVIGIVASRLKEKFWVPSIVFASAGDGLIQGSGRSIPGVHLRDVIDLVSKRYPEFITKFGGHAMAAGLTMHERYLEEFKPAFNQAVVDISGITEFNRVVDTDGPIDVVWAQLDTAKELDNIVWGAGFPKPLFNDSFKVLDQTILKEKHSRLRIEKDGVEFKAIYFNFTEALPPKVELIFTLNVNQFNGLENLQLMVQEHLI
ncbi:single-stranded-DNA-specific exonuclease [Taylorella asinigenitalis 14/45]|uniref:Single-stranded-DNA-specific exonuclease RecJ n=1 Tax=Taylorella asinigenitalis 14/45 TaxID=1091495 RepID=I7IL02_9BURK|nr:single-stranded-DNA-specific exonuclease RecJ [Taylorella asinigenitalis]CCG19657.1 single-stranded-DNA-specific exonuclease [Taylorella asinigenitalis 14/45]